MRKFFIAALTVALVSAPAWAHGASVSIRTPAFSGGTIAVGEPYGHHHGHGHHHHGKYCRYIQGHYEKVYQQVWVPGYYRQDYVPPVYKQKRVHGVTFTVMVSNGYHTKVWVPGHYTTKTRQVWHDGYWSCGR
jgi:hypothetical protein